MNEQIYSPDIIEVLRQHARQRTLSKQRLPRFIFVCGAAETPEHPARGVIKSYVSKNKKLDNVFCLTAESVTNESVFGDLDLVTQEAMIADVADCLIVFAESIGSYCELGMFTALPHALSITSVAIDKKYKDKHCFLTDGPVRAIEGKRLPLCRAFYLDPTCPLACAEFVSFIDSIQTLIQSNNETMKGQMKKLINTEQSYIDVGSLVHELIDLINLLEPITCSDLKGIYCAIKRFDPKRIRIVSPIIKKDLRRANPRIRFEQVVDFMRVNGIVTEIGIEHSEAVYYSNVKQESYYMFMDTLSKSFQDIKPRVLLRKREREIFGVKSVYRLSGR